MEHTIIRQAESNISWSNNEVTVLNAGEPPESPLDTHLSFWALNILYCRLTTRGKKAAMANALAGAKYSLGFPSRPGCEYT